LSSIDFSDVRYLEVSGIRIHVEQRVVGVSVAVGIDADDARNACGGKSPAKQQLQATITVISH